MNQPVRIKVQSAVVYHIEMFREEAIRVAKMTKDGNFPDSDWWHEATKGDIIQWLCLYAESKLMAEHGGIDLTEAMSIPLQPFPGEVV